VLPPNARKKKYWRKAKEGKPVRERETETLLCAAKKNYANSTVSEKEKIPKKKRRNPESEDKKNLTLTTTRGRETRDEQGAATKERKKEIGEEGKRKKRDTVVAHAW
jgi:hypothetical protein